jgi:hypothetical protein
LVTTPIIGTRTVDGPATFGPWASIELYDRHVVAQGDRVLYIDENGKEHIYDGPRVVWEHPDATGVRVFAKETIPQGVQKHILHEDGTYQTIIGPQSVLIDPRAKCIQATELTLASNQAAVVVRKDGERDMILGTQTSSMFLEPKETIHTFYWTGGSAEDKELKEPGRLQLRTLRLDETPSWVKYLLRTKDNCELWVHLMLRIKFVEPEKLLKTDDPYAVMYNKIQSYLTHKIGGMTFEEFRNDYLSILKENFYGPDSDLGKIIAEFGLEVSEVDLREWHPVDTQVNRILSESATVATRQALALAQHEEKMKKLEYDEAELKRQLGNQEIHSKTAQVAGETDAAKLVAKFDKLKSALGEEKAYRLVLLAETPDGVELKTPQWLELE